MAKVFKEYKVIESSHLATLQRQVSDLRKNGWDYVGGISSIPETSRSFEKYVQAMELCEEVEVKKEIL